MVVFNHSTGKFNGRNVRKQLRGRWGTLALTTTLTIALSAGATLADPAQIQVQNVAAGSATFNQQGSVTNITAADKTIINYARFDLAAGTGANFIQPSAASTVLNRVNSANPSQLHGTISANGVVYFVNPAGVIFGKNSVINTAGFIAAAGNMSDADFQAGRNRFTNVNGSIINQGSITANNVALIGRDITNTGTIVAPKGAVTLVAGGDVYLSESAQGGILVKVENTSTPTSDKAAIVNSGAIHAEGGCVMLSAGDLYSLAIQTSGSIKASEVKLEGGSTGVVEVTGSIDASSNSAKGGTVLVTGAHVALTGSIDASGATDGGTVKLGGDYLGQGDLPTAKTAYVGDDASINASGGSGTGGTVIVWSDEATGVMGSIRATGASGGGFVETSSKDYLWVAGANVVAGQWLLDPTDVTISAAATSGGTFAGGVFTPDDLNSATIQASTITDALAAGTSVTVNTVSAGGGAGNILVNEAISPTLNNGDVTITFNAAGTFTNAQKIQGAGADALNIVINAVGAVIVQNQLDTNGGDITSSGTSFTTSALGFLITSGGNVDLSGHTGAINLATPVSTSGGDFTSAGTTFINTSTMLTEGGSVTINNAGAITISANIDTTGGVGGDISLAGSSITLNANLSSTDGNLDFDSAVTLGTAVNLATAGGDVNFDAAVNGANDLTISAGTGTVTLANVGNATGLTVMNVLSSGGVTFNGTTYTAAQQSYNAGGGSLSMAAGSPATFTAGTSLAFLNGLVELSNGSDLVISTPNGTINLLGIEGTSAEDVTINAGTGAISLGAIGTGTPGGIDDVTLTATGGITLSGDVATSGSVAINGNLTLGANIEVTTNDETFTVTGTTNGAFGLSVNTGTAQTTFTGIIGGSTPLTSLDIFADAISLPAATTTTTRVGLSTGTLGNSIGVEDATASLNFTDVVLDTLNTPLVVIGDAGHTGNITVGVDAPVTQNQNMTFITAAPGTITVSGDITLSNGGNIVFTNGGLLTIGGEIIADGNFTQNGAGLVTLSDNISSNGSSISFATAVTLGNTVLLDTSLNDGDITFSSTINGTQDLTITAGAGTVTLSGAVGGGTALNSFALNSAAIANLASITADGAIAVTATTINLNGTTYTSNNDALSFTGAVVLGADATITSGGGAGDDVTFSSTVNGGQSLIVNAGAAGNATFTGNVGATTALTALTVSGNDIDFVGNIGGGSAGVTGATSLTAAGTVAFDSTVYNFGGSVAVNSQGGDTEFNAAGLPINFSTSADNIQILGGNVDLGGGNILEISTSGSGSGTGDVSFAGDVIAGGGGVDAVLIIDAGSADVTVNNIGSGDQVLAVDISGGTINLDGNITTSSSGSFGGTNNYVNLDGDVVLTGTRQILATTAAANGDITLIGTVSSNPAWVNGLVLGSGVNGEVDMSGTSLVNLDHLSVLTSNLTLGALTLGDGVGNGGTALDVTTTGDLTLTGNINTTGDTSTNAGNIDFTGVAGDIILDAASITLTTNAAGTDADITIGGNIQGTVAGANDLSINTGTGDITINGEIGTGVRLGEITLRGNDVALNADMESTGLDIRTNTAGSIALGDGADTFDVNGGNVVLYSDSTVIDGAATVTSTGATDASINFAAESAASTIGIGDNAAAGSTLDISEASLQAVDSTFTTIIIGQAGLQSGDIVIDNFGGLTLANAGLRIEATNADVFIEDDINLTGIGISDFTIIGSGSTTHLDADITTSGGVISIQDSVIVESNATLATTGGAQAAGADITITGDIDDDGDLNDLDFDAGTGGAISVAGDVGDNNPLQTLTITQSASATFGTDDNNDFTVVTLAIDDTVGAVTFKGGASITTLTTAAEGYQLVLEHDSFVTNATTLLNTGGVTLGVGGDGDIIHFEGGLVSTASITTLNSEVRTDGNAIQLGATVLAGDSALDSTNNAPVGAAVTTAAVTGNNFNLTLNAGTGVVSDINVGFLNGLGTVTITQSENTNFNGAVIADAVTLTDTNNNITFTSNATIGTLSTAAQGYAVVFNGAVTSVTDAATFSNTGGVTLGDGGGDSLSFNGGLVSTASTTTLGGTIITINNPITLGTTQVNSDSQLSSGSGLLTIGNTTIADASTLTLTSTSGNIQAGSISGTPGGAVSNLTFNSTSGTVTVTGAVGTDLGVLTLTQSGGATFQISVAATTVNLTDTTGAIAFQGNLTATTLNTAAQDYSVSLTGAVNAITNAVTFSNTGGVTLGNGGGDASTFTGGLASTASTTTVNGDVSTTDTDLTLGTTQVNGNSTLSSGTGLLTLGSTTLADNITLILQSTTGNIQTGAVAGTAAGLASNLTFNSTGGTVTVTGTVGTDIGTLTVTDSTGATFQNSVDAATVTLTDTTGTIAFQGNLTATTLNTAGQTYAVSLTGSSNTITNAVTFSNTGGVTLGDATTDVSLFNGGITSTASTTTTQGIIRTSGDTAGFGIITLADDTTIDTTNNGGTAAGATITLGGAVDGAGFDLTLNSGTAGNLAINNAIGGGGAIGLLTITGNTVSFDADTSSTGLLVTAQGNVTVGAGDTVNFGAVASTITSNGTLSAGAGAAVDGGAALTLRPLAVTDGIDVGNDAQGATTGLNVLKTFVSAVSANVTDLVLGYAGTQTGQIVINENTDLLVASNLTVHAGGGLLAANNITLSDAGEEITVNGNTTFGGGGTWTTNAGDITLDGTLAMADGSTVNLLSTGGDVEVTGTINGTTDNDNETLVINAGVGGITLGGNVGGTIPLGTLQLFANDMTFPTLITATNAQLSAGTAGGLIGVEHNGDLDLTIVDHLERLAVTNLTIGDIANTGGITAGTDNDLEDALYNITILSNTGNITLAGNYSSINGSSLTLDTTGNIVIDAGLDIDIDGAFTAQNAAAMSLGAWITTTNDNITINAPLTLTDDVELNTGSGAGNIVFGSTIDGTQELTLSAGTGNLTISGAVGGGTVLTSLVVESATTTTTDAINVNGLLSFTSDEVNFGGGAGTVSGATIDFAPSSGTVTAILIGNNGADAGAASFDLNDTDIAALADGFTSITIGDAGSTLPITIHSSGATFSDSLTLNADGVGGSVTVAGVLSTAGNNDAATLTINGSGTTTTLEANLITEGGAITINDAVVLDGAILLDTTNGGADAAGANITFDTPGTILDIGLQTSTLTLRAGTGGDISVAGDIGSVLNRLSDLTIVSAHDATFDGQVLVEGLLQSAGTGTTTFNSTVSSNGNNINLTTGEVVLNNATMTTGGGGNIAITGAFTVDDASAISSNGSFSQSGGAVSLGSNISTTNSGITIGGALTLTENVTLAAGTAANATAALDDVSAGTNNLTITADEINFGGGANSVTGTGTLTLQPNNDGDAMQLGGVDPGANTLTLDNTDLDALGAGFTLINLGRSTGTHAYSIQAGLPDPTFNDPVVFRGLTSLTLAGTLAVDDDITFDGPLTLSANGNAITTTGDDITINGDLTVSDGNSPIITTQGGADADITINGEINGTPGGGAESITLTAGNDVTLEGDVVIDTFNVNFGQTAGGVLTIENTVTQIDATIITFTGGAADDILRINNPVGDILRTPTGGIDFDGAAQATADALEILGGSADTEVYDVGPANDEGTITFNNGGPDLLTIDFAGLEPILDTVAIVNFTINADNASNSITLSDGTALADGRIRAQIDAFETIEFANKTNLTLNALGGDDTIAYTGTELPTGLNTLTINGAAGDDQFTLGDGVIAVGFFNAAVTFNGGADSDTLIVNDSGNAAATLDGQLTNLAISGLGLDGGISYATTEVVTLSLGSGGNTFVVQSTANGTANTLNSGSGNDTVNVQTIDAGATLAINAGNGNDTINVSNAGSLSDILGALTINGQGNDDELNLDDSAHGVAATYNLTGTTVTRTGIATITFGTLEELNLEAGTGGNTIYVQAVGATTPVTIDAGTGNDDVIVDSNGAAAGGDVDSILGLLTIDGQAGTNTLTLNDVDTIAGAKELTLDGGTLGQGAGDDFFGTGSVVFSNVDDLSILTGTNLTLAGDTTLDADTSLDGTANDTNFTFEGMIEGPGGLTVNAGLGDVQFDDVIGDSTGPAFLTVTAANIAINSDVIDTVGSQVFNGNVSLGDDTEFFTSGAGSSVTFNGDLDGNTFDITISSFEINFTGGADSVSSIGGNLTLLSEDDTQAINIGAVADAGAASLDIIDDDIAALADGFDLITIGNSNGQHTITVDASGASFNDSLELRAPQGAGDIIVNGQLDTLAGGDAGSITLQPSAATTYLNDNLVTAGGDIIISDSVIIGDGLTVLLDTTDGGNVAAGADIDIDGTIDGAVAGTSSLDLEAGSGGQVTLGGAIGGNDALSNLYIRSGDAAGLTLAHAINIDGILRIVSGGIVNQTGGSLTAPLLGVIANGNVTLNGVGNDVDTLAVSNTLADANVAFTDTDGLEVGQVTAYLNFTLTNGIATSGNGNTTLVAGDSVTQTQAINTNQLAVKTLNDGGAGITLGQANDVNSINLQVRNAADDTTVVGDVVFTDTDGFVVTLIRTASNATLENGGAVTQTGAITADGLELLGTGVYTLNSAPNDVNTFAADTTAAISFFDSDGLAIDTINTTVGVATTSNFTLDSDGPVSQNDTITAAGLELLGDGPFVLTNAGNDVDTLAANLAGALSFRDLDGLIIGTVNATNGITSTNSTLNLQTGGTLTISQVINAGTGNLILNAGGAVTQTALLRADSLQLQGAGPFTLTLATNDVDTLAADIGGALSFRDTDDLVVAGVLTNGIVTTNDNVSLQTGGTLAINDEINLGTGSLILNTGGATTQTDAIIATGLELLGTGPFTLGFTNDVDTLAANITQALTFNDVDGLIIGTVNATNGITTTGDAVNVNITGDLDINQAITTTGGAVTLAGNTIDSTAAGDINTLATAGSGGNGGAVNMIATTTVTLAGDINTTGADNAAGAGGNGGDVTITAGGVAGAATDDLTVAVITTDGGDSTFANGNAGNAGNIKLIIDAGEADPRIQLKGNLAATPGEPLLAGTGTAGRGGVIEFVFSDAAANTAVVANLDTDAGVTINNVVRRVRVAPGDTDFFIPDTATVVFRRTDHVHTNVNADDAELAVTVNMTGALTFGKQEKITSVGSLTFDGPVGGAVLAMGTDLTVVGNFALVDITSLMFERRPAGQYWPVSGNILTDLRGDIVIAGTFTTGGATVNSVVTNNYDGVEQKPVIVTETGGVIGGGVTFAGFFDLWYMLQTPTNETVIRNDVSGLSPDNEPANGAILDVRGVGVSLASLATSLASALPDDVTNLDVIRDTGLDASALADLQLMNVPAVPPTGDQLISWFMDEAQTFDDMGGSVTSLRLPGAAVLQARDVFASLYWVTARDPESGQIRRVGLKSEQVREKLRQAVEEYRDRTAGDTQVQDMAGLNRSFSTKAGEAGDQLNRMRLLMQKVNIMGLTAYEQLQVERFIISTFCPENLTADQFRTLLRQGPSARGPQNGPVAMNNSNVSGM